MENKDQLNQIPGKENNEGRDEKTSQQETQQVETPQQPAENQEVTNQVPEPVAETPATEEVPKTDSTAEATDPPVEEQVEDVVALTEEKKEETPVVAEVEEKAKEVVEEPKEEAPSEKPDVAEESKADAKPVDEVDTDPEEDEDELEEEVEIDYETLTREMLVEKLEKLVEDDDVNKIKAKVATIKVTYLKKTKEEKEAQIHEDLSKEKEEKEESDEKEEKEEVKVVEDELETRFNSLFDIYRQKRAIFLGNLEKEKLVNLKRKQDILDELKSLIGSEETLKKTYDDFKSLQESWKNVGMVPKGEVNNLWQNYHFLVEMFFDKVKINKELKDLDLKKNLEQKIELCESAEELLLESSIIKSFKELQRLHDNWKEIGPVPTDKNDEIWERFKSTTDKINQRRRDHYKKLQDQHDTNYEAKTGLCEKADELLAAEVDSIREWQNKTRQFNDLFKVWKTIGPAAKKQNDEIWERFKATLDAFFNEKKDYFGKLKEQQINNYNLKLDLSVRAEALKDSTDWRQSTRELINMQKEWKEVGPVPRKHSDKIWKRFRAACDEFFNHKAEHFSSIREEEEGNMKKKEELIKLVEETAFDDDKNENLNKLKEFQRSWTSIGHVPFKEKDRLQTEFRNVVNKQLDRLNISSNEISMANYRNKMEGMKGSADGNRSLSRERVFVQNKISKLRDDINVWENNIGFLADTKKASLFKDEFEKKINAAKDELKVLESKVKMLDN